MHGPYWNSTLHDQAFLKSLLEEVKDMNLETKPRIIGMVTVASEVNLFLTTFFYFLGT